jgi:hypothetical protein
VLPETRRSATCSRGWQGAYRAVTAVRVTHDADFTRWVDGNAELDAAWFIQLYLAVEVGCDGTASRRAGGSAAPLW